MERTHIRPHIREIETDREVTYKDTYKDAYKDRYRVCRQHLLHFLQAHQDTYKHIHI